MNQILICLNLDTKFEDFLREIYSEFTIQSMTIDNYTCNSIDDQEYFIFTTNSTLSQIEKQQQQQVKAIFIVDDQQTNPLQIEDQFLHKHNHWTFYDYLKNEKRDLTRQTHHFFWLQLSHRILVDFEGKNQRQTALDNYLNDSSLRTTIRTALSTNDTNQIYELRSFLGDLIEDIRCEHEKISESKFIFYKQMLLSNVEFEELKANLGQLICMPTFFIAHRHRSSIPVCLTQSSDYISVIFEIECNSHCTFAFVSSDEILFDFNSTFQLQTIDETIHSIQLLAVNHNQTILNKYIDDIHRQTENLSLSLIFNRLLIDMGKWEQAEIYARELLRQSTEHDLPLIEHLLGQIFHWKGQWNDARIYYDRAYERLINVEPQRIKESADILSNIGEILHLEGKFDSAYDYHQQALKIRNEYYPSDHAVIANSLENIGLVFYQKLQYDDALDYLQQSLDIREIYYQSFHPDIANNLNNISCIYIDQGKYDEALVYQKRAFDMYNEYCPDSHVHLASILNTMVDSLYRKEKYDEGLELAEHALAIQKRFHPD